MNIKALIAALLTVFVAMPLVVLLFGLFIQFLFPLIIIGVVGLFVWIFYCIFCDYFFNNS